MRNIALSVDEDVLAAVRRHAAARNSTVNALVREYLTNLAAHEDRAKQARARMRELSAQSSGRLGRKRWSREDLHERQRVPGYQRSGVRGRGNGEGRAQAGAGA